MIYFLFSFPLCFTFFQRLILLFHPSLDTLSQTSQHTLFLTGSSSALALADTQNCTKNTRLCVFWCIYPQIDTVLCILYPIVFFTFVYYRIYFTIGHKTHVRSSPLSPLFPIYIIATAFLYTVPVCFLPPNRQQTDNKHKNNDKNVLMYRLPEQPLISVVVNETS